MRHGELRIETGYQFFRRAGSAAGATSAASGIKHARLAGRVEGPISLPIQRSSAEAEPDLDDARAQLLDGTRCIQERTLLGVAQEPHAGHGTGRVQLERIVVEVGCKRLEFQSHHRDAVRLRLTEPPANVSGKAAPPFHRRVSRRALADLRDDVGVRVPGKPIDDLRLLQRGPYTEHTDGEPADEERDGELGQNGSRRKGQRQRDRGE